MKKTLLPWLRNLQNPQNHLINITIIWLLFMLCGCTKNPGDVLTEPITEQEWSTIFLEASDNSLDASDNSRDAYLVKILNRGTKLLNSSTSKIVKSREENNSEDLRSGLREGLMGHLLSWYSSELSPLKGTSSWSENRRALLENRHAYVEAGLNSDAIEASFINMNKAARTLALPTIDDLN